MMRIPKITLELSTWGSFPRPICAPLALRRGWIACCCLAWMVATASVSLAIQEPQTEPQSPPAMKVGEPASAMFAGGCFWSMESDFEHCPGVLDAVSGYSGGRTKNPTYYTYESGGHREVVLVYYDPSKVTYAGLVEYFLKHIDPFDRAGTFIDRGKQYSSAIYVADEEEEKSARTVIKAIDGMKVFKKPINIPVLKRADFFPAENYHQNYHLANAGAYGKYRATCGRDDYVMQVWGQRAKVWLLPTSVPNNEKKEEQPTKVAEVTEPEGLAQGLHRPWESFKKPKASELKKRITKLQFRVTQSADTEPAFANNYWNHHAVGIYVDVVSGEPLFASYDKFDSGTGWPSFVVPLVKEYIEYHPDSTLAAPRIEVRSKFGQSHLGHVFEDGPRERGGLRYCINSAALRFVPLEKMEEEGYGEFVERFRQLQPNPASERSGGPQ